MAGKADYVPSSTGNTTENVTSSNLGFHTRRDGFLYCDDVKVSDIHHQLTTSQESRPTSPAFVYSRRQIEKNVQQFYEAMKALPVPAILNFSAKANYNLQILRLLRSLGCGVTLVSGMEMLMAQEAGFEPQHMLLNGSGKVAWEVAAAVKNDVLLNVDSEFDLQQIIGVCRQLGRGVTARTLLRLNLNIDPKVHSYVSTGKKGSKFGLDSNALSRVTHVLTSEDCPVRVEGLHCHLGSTIKDTAVFRESMKRMLALRQELRAQGLTHLHMLNMGGGLAIDYTRLREETLPFRGEEDAVKTELSGLLDYLQQEAASTTDDQQTADLCHSAVRVLMLYVTEKIPRSTLDVQLKDLLQRLDMAAAVFQRFPNIWRQKTHIPTPADLINCLADVFVMPRDSDVTVIFEPGRAIVGNAGVFVTTTLGCKTAGTTKYLVVDGAMNDVIRPSLYGAYHHIHPAAPSTSISHSLPSGEWACVPEGEGHAHVVDVVGPVCESGDFLGKDLLLTLPPPGACVVLHDAGAYCSAMASNYNLRLRPAEVMVDGSEWFLIRRADTLDDLTAPYTISQPK